MSTHTLVILAVLLVVAFALPSLVAIARGAVGGHRMLANLPREPAMLRERSRFSRWAPWAIVAGWAVYAVASGSLILLGAGLLAFYVWQMGRRLVWRFEIAAGLAAIASVLVARQALGVSLLAVLLLAGGWIGVAWLHAGLRTSTIERWRLRTIRRRVAVALHDAGLNKDGAHQIFVGKPERTSLGHRMPISVGLGADFQQVATARSRVAASVGVHTVRLERSTHSEGSGYLELVERDPIADLPDSIAWPGYGTAEPSIWTPTPFGIGELGQPVSISLVENHVLLAGSTGSGKSNASSLLIAACALDPAVRLFLVDPQELELHQWEPRAERFTASVEEGTDMLREIRQIMQERISLLKSNGMRKIVDHPDLPPIVVVIEEMISFAAERKFQTELRDIISKGRKLGVIVVGAIQHPTVAVLPSEIRENFTRRVAFRTATIDQSEAVLGRGATDAAYSAVNIPLSQRGACIMQTEDGQMERVKTYRLDDEHLARIVAQVTPRAVA